VMVAGMAAKLVTVGAGTTVTTAVWVTAVPAGLVTVRVYVVVAAGLTLTGVPLVAGRLPGVITPEPLAKTAVRLELPPAVMVTGVAAKLVIVGAGTTVTVAVRLTVAPLEPVTVMV